MFPALLPTVLLIFFAVAGDIALIHYALRDRKRVSLRLAFAALAAAGTLCVFIQNHFMSSYLPLLTGDAIDWSLYGNWNLYSLLLWGGVLALFLAIKSFFFWLHWAFVAAHGLPLLWLLSLVVSGHVGS